MKGKSVIEVVVVFLFMKLLSIWLDSWLKDAGIHYWLRNLCFGLQAILIPMAIIFITKRKWKDYGFSFVKLRFLIHYGFIGAMLMLLSGAGFGFLKSQNINSAGMKGSLLLSFIAIIMILLLGFLFRKADHADRNNRKPIVIYKLLILIALVLSPIVIAIFRNALTLEVIAWDAYFLFMVGFGEEIKYRGYFQSRINQEYGRPWKVFGISFGPRIDYCFITVWPVPYWTIRHF